MYMDIIVISLLLQLKHWIADFWNQSYIQTVRKGVYGCPVGFSHTLDHVIGTMIALLIGSLFYPISLKLIIICSILDMILHYHIDWVKVKFGTKDITTSRYWREFGIDQLGHQLTYLLFLYLYINFN